MIKLLTLAFLFLNFSCRSDLNQLSNLKQIVLQTPNGSKIHTRLAITHKDQEQGLSGIKPEDFEENEAMLFVYQEDGEKFFWMPDTYFEIDIFYLDKSFKVIDIIRKLPFYIGRNNPELIPRARGVWARHALEMKSSSKLAQQIKIGDQLILIKDSLPSDIQKLL